MIIKDKRDIMTLKYDTLVELECECCGKAFWKKQKYIKSVLKRSLNELKYCSKECQSLKQKTGNNYKCENCQKDIWKCPSNLKGIKHIFCSQSCSAQWQNKFGPVSLINKQKSENKKKFKCKECGKETKGKRELCDEHSFKFDDTRTIKEMSYSKGSMSNKHAQLRDHARKVAEKNGINIICELCGYNKIVAVCHIKGIASFEETAMAKIVNSPSNLIGLCPNHHWEFDHNLLSDEDKKKIEEILSKRISKDAIETT
jgi:hypothetical protein